MQPTVVFPAILDLLELHAFDLCKIIDPFVRYEPTMPRDIRRHLFSIEEKILESMAWAQGSTLFPLLIMACGGSTPATSRVDGMQGRDSAGGQHATAQQHVLNTGDHALADAGGDSTPAISKVGACKVGAAPVSSMSFQICKY